MKTEPYYCSFRKFKSFNTNNKHIKTNAMIPIASTKMPRFRNEQIKIIPNNRKVIKMTNPILLRGYIKKKRRI